MTFLLIVPKGIYLLLLVRVLFLFTYLFIYFLLFVFVCFQIFFFVFLLKCVNKLTKNRINELNWNAG